MHRAVVIVLLTGCAAREPGRASLPATVAPAIPTRAECRHVQARWQRQPHGLDGASSCALPTLTWLGNEAFQIADYACAIRFFTDAYEERPDPGLQFNLGRVYRQTRDCRAIAHYQRAIETGADPRLAASARRDIDELRAQGCR